MDYLARRVQRYFDRMSESSSTHALSLESSIAAPSSTIPCISTENCHSLSTVVAHSHYTTERTLSPRRSLLNKLEMTPTSNATLHGSQQSMIATDEDLPTSDEIATLQWKLQNRYSS